MTVSKKMALTLLLAALAVLGNYFHWSSFFGLDRMKTVFVSTVSHELRTPLTSIAGALGLAISKELVERMGGRIGFESEEGQGARFYLELAPAPAVRLVA